MSLAGLLACNGPAWALDLAQAYRLAADNDAILASSRANLDAIRERVTQARALLLPGAAGQAQLNRQRINPSTGADFEFTSRIYAINLSVPLYRPQNLTQLDQAKLQVDIGEAQLAQATQDLMIRVSQAYFDVLSAEDNVTTIRSQRRAITEQLASAKRNFEVGTATITDQQEAQARYDLNVSQELAGDNDLAVKRSALALLIGQPLNPLNVLDKSVSLRSPEPAREADWTISGRQSNLGVVQAELASEINRREIDRQRQGHYPTLDLVGSVGRQENPSFALLGVKVNAGTIGLQLNVPLYSGGGVDARVREAAALRNKSLTDLENNRRQAEQGVRTAFLGVQSGLGQVRALEAAEKSSQLALDSNLLGYQVGVRINIDVLNAQQQLYTTRRDLSKARYDVLVNGLKLRQSAGTLKEEDLVAVNSLLSEAPPNSEPPLMMTPRSGGVDLPGAVPAVGTGSASTTGAAPTNPAIPPAAGGATAIGSGRRAPRK